MAITKMKASSKRSNLRAITPGEKMSMTYYLTVNSVNTRDGSVNVTDTHGNTFTIKGQNLIEDTIWSAKQYTTTELISKTRAAELIANAGDTVFTVNFNKQLTKEDIALTLNSYPANKWTQTHVANDIAKNLKGEERTMTCYLLSTENILGRAEVMDLDKNSPRQVDFRTLNWVAIQKEIEFFRILGLFSNQITSKLI